MSLLKDRCDDKGHIISEKDRTGEASACTRKLPPLLTRDRKMPGLMTSLNDKGNDMNMSELMDKLDGRNTDRKYPILNDSEDD